jgi:plastocyanin
MEYEPKPDNRLWAILIIASALVPAMVAVELAVPGYQPRLGGGGSPSGPGGGGGGGGGSAETVHVVMPSGVQFKHTLNFQPAHITVVVGKNNTISWTNQDSADHTVTFYSGPQGVQLASISDSDVGAGQTYTVTLSTPGTYEYHCSFHPAWMIGSIVVKS